ncbi:MAG: type I-E CRISPR-associated protein Cse1/CasA [Planctomycetes bacterium]|nr:type I-E CRISPR-associated protein Cse1/CasA [Planctomycetota bacterium]
MASFNLIDEKWIPCVEMNGHRAECGLLETLSRAHEFEDIQDASPLVTVSLFRLLLVILHRNFGPGNPNEWIALWNKRRWDAEMLEAYLGKFRSHFDLFDDKRPFFQTPILAKEKKHPPQLLSLESAAGNNPTLFDHSWDESGEKMEPAKAARYLVARQAFSIGFGKSKPFYLSDSSLIRGLSVLLVGTNLFESLALNLIAYTEHRPIPRQKGKPDVPCWEQEERPTPEKKGTIPYGYLDYLTWQSRGINLIQDPASGGALGCRILQNLKLKDPVPLDPFKCYSEVEKKGLVPTRLREDRALWRDCHVLLQTTERSFKRPEVFNWLARVASLRPRGLRRQYQFRAIGVASAPGKAASVIFWRHEKLPLPLAYLADDELVAVLKGSLAVAEETGGLLRKAVWLLAGLLILPDESKKPGKETKKDISRMCDNLAPARPFWSQLETPFKQLLEDLPEDKSTDQYGSTVYGAKRRPKWADTVRRAAQEAFDLTCAAVGESARALKARARAQSFFARRLSTILKPYSGQEEEGGEDV